MTAYSTHAAGRSWPRLTFFTGPFSRIRSVLRAHREMIEAEHELAYLRKLDPRLLDDIGVDHSSLYPEPSIPGHPVLPLKF